MGERGQEKWRAITCFSIHPSSSLPPPRSERAVRVVTPGRLIHAAAPGAQPQGRPLPLGDDRVHPVRQQDGREEAGLCGFRDGREW